ncbi:MAG: septum formation initiator family protein [Bacteroidetes bacterium]|nr:septum formation initiator family protein [Bacteroidota bacterium]
MTAAQKKILISFGAISLLLLIAFTLIFTEKGFYSYYKMKNEKEQLQLEIDSLTRVNDSLKTEIELLQTSDEKIEKVAREKFGLVKPGEKIYKFEK